jgi:hypothetical protein
VERQESVAHISQAEQEAVQAADAAMAKIEEAAKKPTPQPAASNPPSGPPKPAVKPRCVVKAADLVTSSYLETSGDVNQFIEQLRKRLDQAIASGQRIQIR